MRAVSLILAMVSLLGSVLVYGDFSKSHGQAYGDFSKRDGRGYQLNFSGRIYNDGATISLKRELARQYRVSREELERADLVSVTLVAKTKFGEGTAALVVDGYEDSEKRVYGRPHEFHGTDLRSYDEVTFYSEGRRARGDWQLQLRGNFNVWAIAVELRLRPHLPPHGPKEELLVSCESNDRRYNTCSLPGRVYRARLVRQYSRRPCEEGSTWGFDRNYIWVDQGCRADFEVIVGEGPRRSDHEDFRGRSRHQ